MSPELLDKILKKATAECEVTAFELYNWTEPLLHPKLPELIRIVRSYGVRCGLSANLNVIKNMEGILGANPTYLTISVSGFTQDGYAMTHARGKIDLVKQNMAEVARAKDRTGATMEVRVAFHRYLGNHQDELEMKEYTESLGFRFDPEWAYLMPLEKVLAYTAPDSIDVELTDQDRDLIDRLAMPLAPSIAACTKHRQKPCVLRDARMALTFQGDVMLCCTVYDQSQYKLASFLETPLENLQEMKYRHRMCESCMTHGIHVLFTYGTEELDEVALENVAKHYPDTRLIGMHALMRKARPRGIYRLARKVRRKCQNFLARFSTAPRPLG